MLIGIIGSSVLCGLYAYGGLGWVLGFVALAPWLCSLNGSKTFGSTLLSGYGMSIAYSLTVFAWFGLAIGDYTKLGQSTGLLVLVLMAPLFQPQILAFALARHWAGRRYGPWVQALAGAAAWVATERLVPKLLGDTLGYGLYPATTIRQAADLIGSAGLTFCLLLANEATASTWGQRRQGVLSMLKPAAIGLAIPLLLAAYGAYVRPLPPSTTAQSLRVGLIQSNLVAYEQLRAEKGAFAAVREVLDLHYAMSYDAVERQKVDVVLWSETAYPTTLGHPKSQTGAELDQEILSIVQAAQVPFVMGTYDRDAAGEYNAAAIVTPKQGVSGMYRKTRLFPLTEWVPAWLDGPNFRSWLPWTGTWLAGNGARVFPLPLKDGREIPVLPLICLDDVDTRLAIHGARLGAQAIITLSNDSWFTQYPQGAALHHAVAAFRSIETRLPQYRVTTNGYSAVIDGQGHVTAGSRLGERTLVVGALPIGTPAPTLLVRWGDWVGLVCVTWLGLLAITALLPRWQPPARPQLDTPPADCPLGSVAVLPLPARLLASALRAFARCALIWLALSILLDDSLRVQAWAQIRLFMSLCLVPEAAAWFVLRAFAATASIESGQLVLRRGKDSLMLPLADIRAVEPSWLPLPTPGLAIHLRSGRPWPYTLAVPDPAKLMRVLTPIDTAQTSKPSIIALLAQTREATRPGRIAHPLVKFALLPLALSLIAFNLHQHIVYGSLFGEYYVLGLKAYLTTLLLWWGGWLIGMTATAAVLRLGIESITLVATWAKPQHAADTRYLIERMGLLVLYVGVPVWLLIRVTGIS
ncbi:apolipoprotein N-acyltransferase [Chitinivorax tropicus]|uniref:Apolipoprotein N-acyltransferase n=1 Tax=Chitinivorax tropicus TaxID=714531 RepID=A0A840MLL9_9PROT|nr:apolipoprotein N-acyltransferase [Chitinivorax tropicus]MBB5018029.1 apolipoprotein N-acyltransferase [Chitinivorax tropicus]